MIYGSGWWKSLHKNYTQLRWECRDGLEARPRRITWRMKISGEKPTSNQRQPSSERDEWTDMTTSGGNMGRISPRRSYTCECRERETPKKRWLGNIRAWKSTRWRKTWRIIEVCDTWIQRPTDNYMEEVRKLAEVTLHLHQQCSDLTRDKDIAANRTMPNQKAVMEGVRYSTTVQRWCHRTRWQVFTILSP